VLSIAQHEAVIAEIEQGTKTLGAKLNQVIPAADSVADQWWVGDVIGGWLVWVAKETVELGEEILQCIADLLKGAVAPIFMWTDSWKWTDLKNGFAGVETDLTTTNLVIDDSKWSGAAKDAYLEVAEAQSAAAGRLSSVADGAGDALMECAAAGGGFYVLLAGVVAKLIIAASAAVAAFSTAIFSELGALIFLEEGGVNVAVIAGAVGVLAGFLGDQAHVMIKLHGSATDPTGFPRGVWPRSNAAPFNDATVNDGDADWSLKGD
jgi:hypothetical protein